MTAPDRPMETFSSREEAMGRAFLPLLLLGGNFHLVIASQSCRSACQLVGEVLTDAR